MSVCAHLTVAVCSARRLAHHRPLHSGSRALPLAIGPLSVLPLDGTGSSAAGGRPGAVYCGQGSGPPFGEGGFDVRGTCRCGSGPGWHWSAAAAAAPPVPKLVLENRTRTTKAWMADGADLKCPPDHGTTVGWPAGDTRHSRGAQPHHRGLPVGVIVPCSMP